MVSSIMMLSTNKKSFLIKCLTNIILNKYSEKYKIINV
jgi:hypothetical protein